MATISDFHPYIMPAVQGCPVQLVNTALRGAINDFCERTHMWRYSFVSTNLVAGQSEYTFTSPAGTVIAKPVYVAVNKTPVVATNIEDLDTLYSGWRESSASQPNMYYMDYNSHLVLVPAPAEAITAGLDLDVALKMDITSADCPDWLFQNWAEAIAHGALMRLHAMPGKAWADPQTVAYHKAKFREGITYAKSRTMKSFSRQGKTVQPRTFWLI